MLKSSIFIGTSCADDGKCNCKADFTGDKCGSCIPDRFNFPKCEPCNCDPKGVTEDFFAMGGCANTETDPEILCTCKENVMGHTCEMCKPLFWNLNSYNEEGCEDCGCNMNGTIGALGELNKEKKHKRRFILFKYRYSISILLLSAEFTIGKP